jgi:hypothetical protein
VSNSTPKNVELNFLCCCFCVRHCRGLRRARLSLINSPLQAEISREQGEAAGAYIAQRVRRDAILNERRTNGLSKDTEDEPWRVHVAAVEPGGNSILDAPVLRTAEAHLQRVHDRHGLNSWGENNDINELRARIGSARVSLQGAAGRASPLALFDRDEQTWLAGDTAEVLVGGSWNRCKIIGAAAKLSELTVLVTQGEKVGDIADVEDRPETLRRTNLLSEECSWNLAQARQAHTEVRAAIASNALSSSDRSRLASELRALKSDIDALEFAEKHGRTQVPIEISRFMRMRIGIIQRNRSRRRQERRFPACSRCNLRARGAEDLSNGAWYCRLCWAEYESTERELLGRQPEGSGDHNGGGGGSGVTTTRRLRPGAWIHSGMPASRQLLDAGTTVVQQRRMISELQSQVCSPFMQSIHRCRFLDW